jgi:hypothetical protein
MRRECQVRIEQPARLRPFYVESFRRDTRLGVRGLILLGLLPSALVLGSLALRASDGQAVAAWQWLGGVGMGPVCVGLVRAALRLHAAGDRFAEIRGDRVRLGPVGYTFRPALLVYCMIEPDSNFPEVNHLCFCFRLFRFARPRYWTMMVEDLAEAEDFRREVVERSA